MASRSLGTLTLDLVAKIGGFNAGMDKAARNTDKRMQQMAKEAKRAGAIIGSALATAATAAAVAIKNSIDRMDDLSKAAQRANMPTEDFSRLAYAGSLADVAMEDLTKTMGKLVKSQGDAARGLTTQVQAFKDLGIDAVDPLTGKLRNTTEVFLEFADVFQKNRNSPEIMTLGMEVFGRSFQKLIPLLKDGRDGLQAMADESDRLGYTISTQAGEQAEEFNDNLTRLKTGVMGLANAVAADLLPDLVDLSQGFLDTSTNGDKLKDTAEDITGFLRGLAQVAHVVWSAFELVGTGLATIAAQGAAVGKMLMGDFSEGMALYREAAAGFNDELDEALGRTRRGKAEVEVRMITGSSGGIDPRDLRPLAGGLTIEAPEKKTGKTEAEKDAERLESAYESLNGRLHEQMTLYGLTGEAVRVRYEIEHGALQGLEAAKAAQLIQDAEHLDLLDEIAEHEQLVADIQREHTEEATRRQEIRSGVLQAIEDEIDLVRMSADAQEIWNNLKWAGVSAESEWGRQIVAATQELQRQREIMDDQITAMDGLRDASRGFLDDLREGVGVWDSLKNAADSFADVLWEIALNNLVEGLFGKQGDPGGGNWGDAIGNFFGNLFGGGKASGGTGMPNTLYEVNERGFEMASVGGRDYLLTGPSPVQITPNHALGGGAVFTQVINNNFASPTDPRTRDQVAAKTGAATQRALARNN